MPGSESNVWCLESFSLIDVLSEVEQDALTAQMEFLSFKPGETIYLPDHPTDLIYKVHEGYVRINLLTFEGKKITLSILGPGQIFGEMAFAGQSEQRWMAEAVEQTLVCHIDKKKMLQFMKANAKLDFEVKKLLGDRLIRISNRVEELLFKRVPQRLAETLIKISEQHGIEEDGQLRIPFRLTHQELADLIAATRESTSNAIAKLRSQKLITSSGGWIGIRDADGLRDLS